MLDLDKLSRALGSPVLSVTVRAAAPSAGPNAYLVTITVGSDAVADRMVRSAARGNLPAGVTGVRRARRPATIIASVIIPG